MSYNIKTTYLGFYNSYLEIDLKVIAESIEKVKNHIENILESAKLLDALYTSAEQKKEILL